MMHSVSGVVNVFCVAVLVSVVSAGAPGDEDSFCTNELPSSDISPPIYPPNSKILLDSYNYVNLLPPQDGAVWQAVDNDLNNEAGRGTEWTQNSNIPCRQHVTVCGFETGPQNNWLITQYISTVVNDTRLAQISVTVEYELVGCTSLMCQRTFVVNSYETSTEDNSIAADINNTDYRLVARIFTDVETGQTRQNRTVDVNLNGNADGLYLAIRDETTCIVITRMLVFYNVCPGGVVDFVMHPETLAPIVMRNPIPLKVNAECVAGASPENGEGAILNCNQGGTWTVVPGAGCQCNPGFVAAENGRSCTGCPAGEYLSVANAECRVCPGNSEGTVFGLTVCPCVDGYYRAEGEEDRECTRPPSAPRNLMVVSTTSTTITLSWDPPESLGGRTDLTYVISYHDSQDSTVTIQVNVTTFNITDLLPGMEYIMAVRAENGVSLVANGSSNAGTLTVTVLLDSRSTLTLSSTEVALIASGFIILFLAISIVIMIAIMSVLCCKKRQTNADHDEPGFPLNENIAYEQTKPLPAATSDVQVEENTAYNVVNPGAVPAKDNKKIMTPESDGVYEVVD